MDSREPPKLDQLSDTYEIAGEISGRTGARVFMAKRKADAAEVLVTVPTPPEGDEGNALSHLAADTNLLKGRDHRTLLPILDCQWVGDDLVIISERPDGSTLEALLAQREEEFEFPRIALILQELNGLLEWARGQKVVHRALGTDSIFLEPGSDRVLATFEVRALPIADMPGPEEDARTIARLARAMLTRSAAAPERESQPLDALRPGLPASVVAQTDALLQGGGAITEAPDVKTYIASIAMAEALKRGETECAQTQAKLQEEEQAARAAIVREKDAVLTELAKERQQLLKVRDVLERERAELAKLSGELQAQRDLYARTETYETPVGKHPLAAIPEPRREPTAWRPIFDRAGIPRGNRALMIGAGAVALLLVVALAAVARRPSRTAAPRGASAIAMVDSAAGVSVSKVTESAGETALLDSTATLGVPGIPADLVSGVANRAALAPPRVVRRPRPRPVDSTLARRDSVLRDTLPRRDTLNYRIGRMRRI